MGRTVIGYELQRIFAAADWLEATRRPGTQPWELMTILNAPQGGSVNRQFLGVVGHGEGGLLALYAAACDTRFQAAYVSGYFGPKEQLWRQPIDRNVFGLLREFGDAEIAALVAPRNLLLETGAYPAVVQTDARGGAPGSISRPEEDALTAEEERRQRIVGSVPGGRLNNAPDRFGDYASRFLFSLTGVNPGVMFKPGPAPVLSAPVPDAADRSLRQYRQLLEDTQWLMREGEYARRDYWKAAPMQSLAAFTNASTRYREDFRTRVIGEIPRASVPPDPQTRFLGETNGVRRYEVVLQVHPDVFAFGILCVPTGIAAGERRPVVVCQHGLEGRPTEVSDPAVNSHYYHQYGLRLAERGFVTFAPQNPYIGGTRFRQVLHQAQPLGLTLWSFMIRQHEVITDWLAAQPFVDPARIAFYGLSYGGKSAMRIPILVERYCLSICSADYNEWIWKNVSARSSYSYLFNNEYDMPEWNLGNTFNYAEMSWLIFPRPFMVERGHDDGVAPDEWVAYEYAKTRRHYVKMGLADRTEIEFFDGPHSIHGVGTFAFLHRHLGWAGGKEVEGLKR
jgi:dienelactone hydrolase